MELMVTKEIAARAKARGACKVPKVGTPLSALTFEQLMWADTQRLLTPEELSLFPIPENVIFGTLPIWAFSGSGYGYGDGSGYGYGYGFGKA